MRKRQLLADINELRTGLIKSSSLAREKNHASIAFTPPDVERIACILEEAHNAIISLVLDLFDDQEPR